MQTRNPWQHPQFWPYINRCILRGLLVPASEFLSTLSTHPHPPLAKIGSILAHNLSSFPRSHNVKRYAVDHQFIAAHENWLSRFQSELAAVTSGPAAKDWLGGGEDMKGTEEDLRAVVDLMEGKADRVLEQSTDWREALGAWGVLVKVDMGRDDLPYVPFRAPDCCQVDVALLRAPAWAY